MRISFALVPFFHRCMSDHHHQLLCGRAALAVQGKVLDILPQGSCVSSFGL